MSRIGAMTCSSHCSRQSSSVSTSSGRIVEVPALLTSTSTPPICSAQVATMRSGASASVTSIAMYSAPQPSAASASAGSSRATMSTSAPSAHRRRAVSSPIPRLAPVTTQTLPATSRSMAAHHRAYPAAMRAHTRYLTFETPERRQFVRITDDVQQAVDEAGIAEGLVLVSAMHITAGGGGNEGEAGVEGGTPEGVGQIPPPSWKAPANDVAREPSPDPGDFRHHRGGEDNGDAHLKNLLVHHQVIVPITDGRLDLGPWQAIFYLEFDGRRRKRLIIKVLGE